MDLNKNEILNLLREEYENRINHYVNLSELETRDKNDNNLLSSAKGLKIKDKAGFVYTVLKVIQKGNDIFIRLLNPGISLDNLDDPKSLTPITEDDKNDEYKNLKNNIIKKNDKTKFKQSFKTDIDKEKAFNLYSSDEEKYIDVNIKDIEDNFSL